MFGKLLGSLFSGRANVLEFSRFWDKNNPSKKQKLKSHLVPRPLIDTLWSSETVEILELTDGNFFGKLQVFTDMNEPSCV